MGQFGEPWILWGNGCLYDSEEHYLGALDSLMSYEERERIVACTNALSGIPDPAALVEAVKQLKVECEAALLEAAHYTDRPVFVDGMTEALSALRVAMGEK